MANDESLQTARLTLRPFSSEHHETFHASCISDPAVMAFYHAYKQPESDEHRRARAKRDFIDHFEEGASHFGYICWALLARTEFLAPEHSFLGWCGVLTPALSHEEWGPELAYMLTSQTQGFGLATEAAAAVLNDAWHRYSLRRIHAVVDSPNLPSRRVLERTGFCLHGPVEVYGSSDMLVYIKARPGNAAQQQVPADVSAARPSLEL